jgi:hypothetical protein
MWQSSLFFCGIYVATQWTNKRVHHFRMSALNERNMYYFSYRIWFGAFDLRDSKIQIYSMAESEWKVIASDCQRAIEQNDTCFLIASFLRHGAKNPKVTAPLSVCQNRERSLLVWSITALFNTIYIFNQSTQLQFYYHYMFRSLLDHLQVMCVCIYIYLLIYLLYISKL